MFRVLLVICMLAFAAVPAADARSKKQNPAAHEAGRFDYYVLSLSWSPAYCTSHPEDQAQCGAKPFGFVLHGLWP